MLALKQNKTKCYSLIPEHYSLSATEALLSYSVVSIRTTLCKPHKMSKVNLRDGNKCSLRKFTMTNVTLADQQSPYYIVYQAILYFEMCH